MDRKIIFGVILVFFGALLLLDSLGISSFTLEEMLSHLFPIGLIALGVWWIMRNKRKFDEKVANTAAQSSGNSGEFSIPPLKPIDSGTEAGAGDSQGTQFSSSASKSEDGKLKFSQFISDIRCDCQNVEMNNVEVSSFIGEIEVKLHGARLGSGLNRLIISGFIGDVRVFVPNGMPVFVHCSNFIGDIEILGKHSSGIGKTIEAQTTNYTEAKDKLFIAISCFISDTRVYYL